MTSPWLDAWSDPFQRLRCHQSCVRLVDGKLLVASVRDRKLKVYDGTALESESSLPDSPIAIASFYPGSAPTETALVGVAAGGAVYIFRENRAYGKFAIPLLEISQAEQEAWQKLISGSLEMGKAIEALTLARDQGLLLSSRSHHLLALEGSGGGRQCAAFVSNFTSVPKEESCVTCLESLVKSLVCTVVHVRIARPCSVLTRPYTTSHWSVRMGTCCSCSPTKVEYCAECEFLRIKILERVDHVGVVLDEETLVYCAATCTTCGQCSYPSAPIESRRRRCAQTSSGARQRQVVSPHGEQIGEHHLAQRLVPEHYGARLLPV